MAELPVIPPVIEAAVDAMSKLPTLPGGGFDSSSIFSNTIASGKASALASASGPSSIYGLLHRDIETITTSSAFIVSDPTANIISVTNVTIGIVDDIVDGAGSGPSLSTGFDFNVTQQGGGSPDAESTNITTVADVAGSLEGRYFTLEAPGGSPGIRYYVWYTEGGGSPTTDPLIAGRTGIQVTYTADDSAVTIASLTQAAIDGVGSPSILFTAALVGSPPITVSVTNDTIGDVPDIIDGVGPLPLLATGFDFNITQQGTAFADAESTTITTNADVTGSLEGKYFTIDSPERGYYVWYTEGGSPSTNPLLAGRIGVAVAYTAGASADDIASLTQIAFGSAYITEPTTLESIAPFENIFNSLSVGASLSLDMASHVGQLQASLSTVLKLAATVGALRSAVSFGVPACGDDTDILNDVFPATPLPIPDNSTTQAAGTLTGAGDKLQDAVANSSSALTDAMPPNFESDVQTTLNKIKGDPEGDYSAELDGLASPATMAALTAGASAVSDAAQTVKDTFLKERANIGMPNLDGSALTDLTTGITIPAGLPDDIQVGAGNFVDEIKKKAQGLQAISIAGNSCAADIIGRSAPPVAGGSPGVPSPGAEAAAAIQSTADPTLSDSATDEATDIPDIAVKEKPPVADKAEIAEAIAKIETVEWKSQIYKVRPYLASTEEGITYRLTITIPVQAFTGTTPGTYVAEWAMPARHVTSDIFGHNYLDPSIQETVNILTAEKLMVSFYLQGIKLIDLGISKWDYIRKNSKDLVFIGHPDLIFSVDIGIFDIDGDDCTLTEEGTCQIRDMDIGSKAVKLIGPKSGLDEEFVFAIGNIDAQVQFKSWLEKDKPPGVRAAAIRYVDTKL